MIALNIIIWTVVTIMAIVKVKDMKKEENNEILWQTQGFIK